MKPSYVKGKYRESKILETNFYEEFYVNCSSVQKGNKNKVYVPQKTISNNIYNFIYNIPTLTFNQYPGHIETRPNTSGLSTRIGNQNWLFALKFELEILA